MAPGANNGLYNGNISAMQTTLVKVNVGSANASLYTAQPQLAGYKYDQLNRINEMRTYADLAGGSVISNNNYASLSGSADAYRNTFSYDANGNIESQKRYSDNGTLLDDLTYRYELDGTGKKRSNKLYHVNDSGTSASGDINDQGTFSSASVNNLNNYSYDEIGNLVKDKAEEIDKITWTVYGKIKTIERLATSSKPDLEFVYDAQGNRIQKIVKPKSAPGVLVATNNFINTYYTKDAQGNTLATYEKTGGSLKLKDHSIYGSARLGVLNTDKPYTSLPRVYNATNTTGTTYQTKTEGGSVNYEFSNHLGNVLTVVSDRKLPVDNNSDGTIDGFVSDVLSTSDYYAFGAQMPGRQYNSGDYRYGFNGQEKDDEIAGSGNIMTAEFWEYDARLGRRWNNDPVTDASQSPYACFNNNPILFSDPNGDTPGDPYKGGIQVYDAAEAKGSVPAAQSKAGESFKVGDYDLLPNYVTNEKGEQQFSHYTASTMVKQIKPEGGTEEVARIDYILGKDDLKAFQDNVKVYSGAANLMFGGNLHLEKWQVDKLNGGDWAGGYLASQWTNPYNVMAFAHIMVNAWPTLNKVNLNGATYNPVASKGVKVSGDPGMQAYLQKLAPGEWLKVYEAAYLDGKAVEVHYFVHKQTGKYFDSKIKQQGWSDQFTKGKNKVTGQE